MIVASPTESRFIKRIKVLAYQSFGFYTSIHSSTQEYYKRLCIMAGGTVHKQRRIDMVYVYITKPNDEIEYCGEYFLSGDKEYKFLQRRVV